MLEYKKSVYAKLSGDSTLTSLATIHDHAKLDEDLPYVDLAGVTEQDWSTKTFTGSEYSATIHVWGATSNIVLQIIERIRTLLHRQPLTITGENFILMYHEDTNIFIDADEMTMHGVVSFRALTHT